MFTNTIAMYRWGCWGLALLGMSTIVLSQTPMQDKPKEGSYMTVREQMFIPGQKYSMFFQLLRHVNYEVFDVEFCYTNYTWHDKPQRNITVATGTISLSSSKPEGTLQIQIPSNIDDDYHLRYFLRLKGSGTVSFLDTLPLYRGQDDRSRFVENIFIHTDKLNYKTGQKVKYRVFVLDKELKPIDPVMDISIKDFRKNKIKEHNDVRGIYGVSGELQLAEQPMLGLWKIDVKLKESNTTESKEFYVKEYVLPTYSVKVELPSFGTVDNPELKGKVVAKYTYGKPVQGRVVLRVVKRNAYWWYFEPRAIQTEFDIDGEADFSIATNTLLKFDPSLKYDTLAVIANVSEKETGEVRVTESSVTFHEQPLKIEFLKQHGSDVFRPGFRYTHYVKVSQPDGRPVSKAGERLKLSVTYFTDKAKSVPYQFRPPTNPTSNAMTFMSPFDNGNVLFMPDSYLSVPRDGIVKIDLDIPEDVATGHITVNFKDQKESYNIERFRTESKSYLNLEMKTAYVKVGDQAEFEVNSNSRGGQKVTYHIVNNGKILQTHFTSVNSAFSKTTFYVTMTADMVPNCNIVAYFHDRTAGEIIADGLKFSVDMSMKNDVSLRFDRAQVSPGTNVTLLARADPNSLVFIRVVDKSVSGNDITEDNVYGKMGIRWLADWKYGNKYLYHKIAGNDLLELFSQAGIDISSDADLYDFDWYSLRNHQNRPWYGHYNDHDMALDINEAPYMRAGFYLDYMPDRRVRFHFPETWIWLNDTVGSTGSVNIGALVPDKVTDWVATAYALNKDSGIGVTQTSTKLTAFLPFYISLHLPFSIVSDEVAVIQALVFNYYPHDTYVTVTLKNNNEDFVGLEVNQAGKEEEQKEDMVKCVLVKSDDVVSAYFTIKPHRVGTIDLQVEAQSSRGSDTIRRQLIVRPPGIQEEKNIAHLITLKANDTYDTDMPVMYPPRIVPGSQRVQVTVIGDLFGPSLDHLDRLIQIPYGCGEQNMVRFAPAVFAAKYLNITGRFTDTIREKVTTIMETGYQRQMKYLRYDGSFSTFGDSDDIGSLWLTAFVLKSFAQASGFTYIDHNVMERGIRYLLQNQNKDGSFNTTGFVHNKAMQGGSASSSKALAAYVLTAFEDIGENFIMNNETLKAILGRSMTVARMFLSSASGRMTDDYDLAITAYAMALMDAGRERDLLHKLEASRNIRESDGGKYWHHPVKSIEVEIAAYALLTYALSSDPNKGLPILRWIVKQRTPYGGYHSTQDTVVALQGLTEYASRVYDYTTADLNMTIDIDDTINNVTSLTVNAENMDILQLIEIPADARYVRVTARGSGTALVETSTFYNVLNGDKNSSFDLRVTTNGSTINAFTLNVCARWVGQRDSGMVLVEMAFPSGYAPVPLWELYSLQSDKYQRPDRREIDRGHLVLYYNMLKDTQCYRVDVVRKETVGRVQPANVKVFSYYDTDKRASKIYLPNTLKKNYICDFCRVECGCGFDPDAVPKERCLYSSNVVYPQPNRIIKPVQAFKTSRQHLQPNPKPGQFIRPEQTFKTSSTRIIQGPPPRTAVPYVQRQRTFNTQPKPGRSVVPIESFQTLRQRTHPHQWRRGETIPVSFNSGQTSNVVRQQVYPHITRWNSISKG